MFTNKELQDLIDGKIIGSSFPYDTNDEAEIEAHIRRLLYRIKRIPNLRCEAEWHHFGSGYASFIEFFCYEKGNVTITDRPYNIQEIDIEGVLMNISRLAPLVIMGEDERNRMIRTNTEEEIGGCRGSIMGNRQLVHVDEQFQPMIRELKIALEEFGYEILPIEEMNKPLPFQTKIPTLYSEPQEYTIADAIFYWED